MYISRIQINNFRNFHDLDVSLGQDAVVVGENKVGKSNLLHAIRLVLDPGLPDSARQLKPEDFWDGLGAEHQNPAISIALDFSDFSDNPNALAVLGDCLVTYDPMVARVTYVFERPEDDVSGGEGEYQFYLYAGDNPANKLGSELRRRLPLDLLPALRDAEGDLANWRRSPLRPLLDRVAARLDTNELNTIAANVAAATAALTETEEVSDLAEDIRTRLSDMAGTAQAIDVTLGFSPTQGMRLVRALRLFIDGGERTISEASLGSANLLYLTLKALELEQLVEERKRDHTFLAIEEPEAHLHPHLQRLVYRDFLKPRATQEVNEGRLSRVATSILMTTHSPHIVSVSPLKSVVLLRATPQGSIAKSTSSVDLTSDELKDIERYLDVTRGEMLFARGVLLVEGEAELFILPALGKLLGYDFDRLGIFVCSVAGTNFAPYVKLLGPTALDIPFAVLTDGDPQPQGASLGAKRVQKLVELLRPAEELQGLSDENKVALAPDSGIFLNSHTLEVDLFRCGRHNSITATLTQLVTSQAAKARAAHWREHPEELDVDQFLGDIERIGKGRFAQRLASKMSGTVMPEYVQNALTFLTQRLG